MGFLPSVFVAAAILLAGCFGSPEGESPEPSASVDSDLPNFQPVAPEEEAPRTILEAPKWKQGEWWKIRMTDSGFTGSVYETTRVVVGQEGDHYLVGMPMDEFSDDFMVIHIPGFGQVTKEDLSFEVHDALFQPLRFPLVEGDSWVTAFEARAVTMTVKAIESETRAVIEMTTGTGTPQDNANLTYDALIGEVVENDMPNYATYEVVEHGFNYTGVVTVPHMHDLIFAHFRIGPAWNGQTGTDAVATITDSIDVDTTYDRVSFGLIFSHAAGAVAPNAGGYYHELATAPNSEEFELTVMPTDSPIQILTVGLDKPGGVWTFEHQVGGPGFIGAEGIAYHTYHVEMPSGRVLPSTGEHAHGG